MKALQEVAELGAAGRFVEMRAKAIQLAEVDADVELLLGLGVQLAASGLLSDARICYEKAHRLAPADLRAAINLATLMREAGEHGRACNLYAQLLQRLPNNPAIRRNVLTGLEYDPDISDDMRLQHAKAWGDWAIARVGGSRPRPPMHPLQGRRLRLGYASADLCQHTVGLFVKDVLKAHDPRRVQVFAYSAGQVNDWVTNEIRTACTFRDVATLDDAALAGQIRADGIDILIDLSGHTAGSRLTAFAHRPAPVMASWLGYFATTGLPCIDAILLDEWHAPQGSEAQFVESLVRLPSRFCYQPVPWMPEASTALPASARGHITFGSFNNTAKLNPGVLDTWARLLLAVPDARLVLKWRTFNDDAYKRQIIQSFELRGVPASRLELRGPSFHADMLREYSEIDIALDPFPFTGGLTSCEALWMGVPIVTWPQSRVVSRQTLALLNLIGLPELSARSGEEYIQIATRLANDRKHLTAMRTSLRESMQGSALLDVTGFTRSLEDHLIALYEQIAAEQSG